MILTYQDFLEQQNNIEGFIGKAINQHVSSDDYKIAIMADRYDRQLNDTIYNYLPVQGLRLWILRRQTTRLPAIFLTG